jgi:hypothetical protein
VASAKAPERGTVRAVARCSKPAARLLGLVLDGAAPFTLRVLKPELALIALSTTALLLERRRPGQATQVGEVASHGS